MNFIHKINNRLTTLIPVSSRSKNISFFICLLGSAMDNLNVTGSYALYDSIQEYFGADSPTVSWTLSAYALTLGAFIMLVGKICDIIGSRTVFLYGLFFISIFAVITAAIEDQIIVLIVFRALQGFAAASLIPCTYPIAYEYYGASGNIGTALNMIMFAYTGSNGLGLVLGGAFSLSSIGYKGFYYMTSAVSLACWFVLYIYMYPVPVHHQNKDLKLKNLDWPGTILFIIGVLLMILGLTEGGDSWKKPSAYVPLPVGFAVLLFTLWFEIVYIQNHKDMIQAKIEEAKTTEGSGEEVVAPKGDWMYDVLTLFPREVFGITNFIPFIIATLCDFIVFLAINSLGVQYAEHIEGDNALIGALKAFPATVGIGIGVLLNRERLMYKVGMKFVLVASQVALLGCVVWISRHDYTRKDNYWIFGFVPFLLSGWMVNVYFGIYLNAVMRKTPGHLQGTVAALLQTVGQVGLCLGNAILATVLGVMEKPTTEAEKKTLNHKFDIAWYITIAVQGFMCIVLLFIKNQKSLETTSEEDAYVPEVAKETTEEGEKDTAV